MQWIKVGTEQIVAFLWMSEVNLYISKFSQDANEVQLSSVQFPQTGDLFTVYIGLRPYNTFTNTLQNNIIHLLTKKHISLLTSMKQKFTQIVQN